METNGEAFHKVTAGMTPTQKNEVQQGLEHDATVQKLSAHKRTVTARITSETMRQTKSRRLVLK